MSRWTGSPEGAGTQGTRPAVLVACVGRERSEVDKPRGGRGRESTHAVQWAEGVAERQEHAVKEKERQGMGTQLAGGLEDAQPAEGGGGAGAGGLWGQAGWTMVAPGRLTGGLWPCAPRL